MELLGLLHMAFQIVFSVVATVAAIKYLVRK